MRKEDIYFDCYPKVVQANQKTTITIKSLYDHCRFEDGKNYIIEHTPVYYRETGSDKTDNKLFIKAFDKKLEFTILFQEEQEHIISVFEKKDDNPVRIGDFHLYSLEHDLFTLRPYKGDLHIHTNRSDGTESPAYVAAACRRSGLDFVAITDHSRYEPSIEAINRYKDLDLNMALFYGEEVHPPENPIHIINFGGESSVSALFKNNQELYYREVKEIEEGLEVPEGVVRFQAASAIWAFNKVKEAEGLAIFSHPYWIYQKRLYISEKLTEYLLKEQPFDAVELISGYYGSKPEENNVSLMLARYIQANVEQKIPMIAVTDAHSCETGNIFGSYYTIVFAEKLDIENVKRGIIGMNSVAVEAIPGETVRVYGSLRLVKFANFLLQYIYPQYNELCREEGQLMFKYICEDTKSGVRLNELKGQNTDYFDKYWQ